MNDNSALGRYVNYPINVVKFKKGQTEDRADDDSLWNITVRNVVPADNTMLDLIGVMNVNNDKCVWVEDCMSAAPSETPTSEPSATLSNDPSTVPSKIPSTEPSASTPPSVAPSAGPSVEPSTSFQPSDSPSTEPSFVPSTSPSEPPTSHVSICM